MGEPINFLKKKAERDTQKKSSHSPIIESENTAEVASVDFGKLADNTCFDLGHKYRFLVLKDGFPEDRKLAHDVTMRLRRALGPLADEFGANALYNLMGVQVLFSQTTTEYKIASGGWRRLYLSNSFTEEEVQNQIRPLLAAMTPEQRKANTNIHNVIYGDGLDPFKKD